MNKNLVKKGLICVYLQYQRYHTHHTRHTHHHTTTPHTLQTGYLQTLAAPASQETTLRDSEEIAKEIC